MANACSVSALFRGLSSKGVVVLVHEPAHNAAASRPPSSTHKLLTCIRLSQMSSADMTPPAMASPPLRQLSKSPSKLREGSGSAACSGVLAPPAAVGALALPAAFWLAAAAAAAGLLRVKTETFCTPPLLTPSVVPAAACACCWLPAAPRHAVEPFRTILPVPLLLPAPALPLLLRLLLLLLLLLLVFLMRTTRFALLPLAVLDWPSAPLLSASAVLSVDAVDALRLRLLLRALAAAAGPRAAAAGAAAAPAPAQVAVVAASCCCCMEQSSGSLISSCRSLSRSSPQSSAAKEVQGTGSAAAAAAPPPLPCWGAGFQSCCACFCQCACCWERCCRWACRWCWCCCTPGCCGGMKQPGSGMGMQGKPGRQGKQGMPGGKGMGGTGCCCRVL